MSNRRGHDRVTSQGRVNCCNRHAAKRNAAAGLSRPWLETIASIRAAAFRHVGDKTQPQLTTAICDDNAIGALSVRKKMIALRDRNLSGIDGQRRLPFNHQ
jgi:hypothetical protein